MAIYQLGSKGPEVARIQQRLQELGSYLGPIDGIFGGGTEAAVKTFQQSAQLGVDGRVGPQTWAALFPGTGIPARQLDEVIGRVAKRAIAKDRLVSWDDLQ